MEWGFDRKSRDVVYGLSVRSGTEWVTQVQ
jgi:hypothetical protein